MAYAPTAAAVMRKRNACQGNWKCAKCRGVWHTPITPPHKPRLKLPAQYRKSVQFRAYAIRPYGGGICLLIVACVIAALWRCKKWHT